MASPSSGNAGREPVNRAEAEVYRCPVNQGRLVLETERSAGEEVVSGVLVGPHGRYEIREGIPDFTHPSDLAAADQTARNTYDSVAPVYDEYIPLTFSTFGCD